MIFLIYQKKKITGSSSYILTLISVDVVNEPPGHSGLIHFALKTVFFFQFLITFFYNFWL